MNVDLYLFGDFGNGYTQYIDDNTRVKFKSFVEKAKAKSQLIINREDALIYYTYIRRLHSEGSSNVKYIGISYVLNTHFIQDVDGLFEILEGAVTTIASRGVILKYLPSGQITTNVGKIYQAKAEFAHISAYLKSELDAFMVDKKCKLPTLDFSINTSELKTFKFTDPREDIIKSISTFPTVYIYKDKNYENEESKSFSSTLSMLNKEKTAAEQTIVELKQEISKLKVIQKNYKLVIGLVIFICVGGLICFISIKNKDADIVRLQNNVATQDQTIASQSQTIDMLRDTVITRNRKIQSLKTEVESLKDKRDSLIRSNHTLTTEKNTLADEKSKLITKLNRTDSTLRDANAKISSKDKEIQKLNSEVSKYKSAKKEPEKYKTKHKANCYYKDGNYQYRKTGDYYSKNTTINVYYTTYKYALTEKGYVLLSDLQKLY